MGQFRGVVLGPFKFRNMYTIKKKPSGASRVVKGVRGSWSGRLGKFSCLVKGIWWFLSEKFGWVNFL